MPFDFAVQMIPKQHARESDSLLWRPTFANIGNRAPQATVHALRGLPMALDAHRFTSAHMPFSTIPFCRIIQSSASMCSRPAFDALPLPPEYV